MESESSFVCTLACVSQMNAFSALAVIKNVLSQFWHTLCLRRFTLPRGMESEVDACCNRRNLQQLVKWVDKLSRVSQPPQQSTYLTRSVLSIASTTYLQTQFIWSFEAQWFWRHVEIATHSNENFSQVVIVIKMWTQIIASPLFCTRTHVSILCGSVEKR